MMGATDRWMVCKQVVRGRCRGYYGVGPSALDYKKLDSMESIHTLSGGGWSSRSTTNAETGVASTCVFVSC